MSLHVTIAKVPVRLAFLLLIGVPWASFAASPSLTVNSSGWSLPPSINASATHVTLLQLLTNPVPYSERYIQVRGVLSVEFEDTRLYLSKEFFDAYYPEYAIELQLPPGAAAASKKHQGKSVTLRGLFSLQSSRFSHGVLNVTSLVVDGPRRSTKEK